jgi:alkyldihydroxyacetonephosphate synthase
MRMPHATNAPDPSTLRWWGWGSLDQSYDLDARPQVWPFIESQLGIGPQIAQAPVALESIQLPAIRLSPQDVSDLQQIFGDDAVRIDRLARVLHAYGKSYRDLMRIRCGDIAHPPDAIVYPDDEAQIVELYIWARKRGWHLTPFGGGSSVTGGVEAPADARPAITVDLARINRVLRIDPIARTATVQCGIYGPALERALNESGFTLGHFPQSFEFSTLGGWIATRSAGQASIGYGKIEEMVERVRLVAPRGVVDVKPIPAAAAGPDMLRLLIGSEGALGIIIEATLRIKPLPAQRNYFGVLFHTFEDGAQAVREMMQREIGVSMARLSDDEETRTALILARAPHSHRARLRTRAGQWFIRRRGYDMASSCLMVVGIEAEAEQVDAIQKAALHACKMYDGIRLGRSVGRAWLRERFVLPYLRDELLDRKIMVDTLETATTWSNFMPLYHALKEALHTAIVDSGSPAFVATHLSHAYRDGASLYATFIGRQQGDPIAQWWSIKRAATEAILAHGGALSHHHGIGRDHAAWLAREYGALGMQALRALKSSFDPDGLLNAGVLDVR